MSASDPFRRDLLLGLLVTVAAVALVAGLRLGDLSRRRQAAVRPNVLLVGLDTVRVDALGAYGSAGARTSTIDALARRGTLFGRALAQAPVTGPSFASILTGRYPVEHTVVHSTRLLPESELTVAERFQQRGYETAAFVSCSIVSREYGFAQGFDHFDQRFDRHYDGGHYERGAVAVTDAALGWLGKRSPDRPFFAWVHYFDAHAPYQPHGFGAIDPAVGTLRALRAFGSDREGRERALPSIRALYDGEVAHVDRQLGRLMGALEAAGMTERTLVVVVADHGEELFDHDDFFGHFTQLTQSVLQVPMLMAGPAVPKGRRVGQWVETVDLLPTLLSLAGLSARPPSGSARPVRPSGRDLTGLMQGERLPARIARAQREPYPGMPGGLAFAAVQGRWKLQWFTQSGARLYDLSADPLERKDLAAARLAIAVELKKHLAPWRAATERLGFTDPFTLPAQDRAVLEALGYIQ